MARQRKYPDELLDRGARMVIESGRPIAHVARDLGIHHEALRKWVRKTEADEGKRKDLLSSQEREELKALRGEVRVFGSVGRGESGSTGDLDLLVDIAEGRSLFDLIALSSDLEESLGVEVDVVTEASLSPYIRDRVLDEAVAL